MEYTGNLYQDIVDMDFIDDPPEISEQERFQRHNRFLRSLKSDTLLIIDNFNVTSTQDSCLSVVLKYRCRVLFTTRSQLSEYCSFQLKELKDIRNFGAYDKSRVTILDDICATAKGYESLAYMSLKRRG